MKECNKIKTRNSKGITLIALVITIIVLLILAGVSIAMLTGENGILTQAQRAKKETEEAQLEEENILDGYEDYLSQVTNGGFIESKGVNAPALGENMELVAYNEETKNWDTNNSSSAYDYLAGEGTEDNIESKWANAKVTIAGVESYFVWIPRFAYKIDTTKQEIDVKFLKGTGNIAADGTVCKYADDNTLDPSIDYIIHPAFTSNVDLGGWKNELTGIWVGKYETSLLNKSDQSVVQTDSLETGNILLSSDTDKVMSVRPKVSSWRFCTVGNMYTNSINYAKNLNSHLLKNSEWGAVVYLTYSQYGRDGTQVSINDSSEYITADGDIELNKDQSSTGNVYGIYDLSGGANEYVSCYYNQSTSSNLINFGGQFASKNGSSTEYTTVYNGTNSESNSITGDAIKETEGWNNNATDFFTDQSLFMSRGGNYHSGETVGIFYFYASYGNGYENYSSRICLAI